MAIDSKHPLYARMLSDWVLMEDSIAGERAIKEKGTLYLPATSAMEADGLGQPKSAGQLQYDAYRTRALYHEVVGEAIRALVGAMWNKPPNIELPAALEPMREIATVQRESLEQLLRRVNEAQLGLGRVGLLVDLPEREIRGAGVLPLVATYGAREIFNWDVGSRADTLADELTFVMLDESEYERDVNYEWVWQRKFRALVLDESGNYAFSTARATDELSPPSVPLLRGQPLDRIPFVFVNGKDIVARPDTPPLLSLARLALAIYRGEADYRQSLYMQGQDTFVTVGNMMQSAASPPGSPVRTGAGAHVQMEQGGSADFVGASADGIAEQGKALESDLSRADAMSGRLLDTTSRQKESGEALRLRITSATTTLNDVALAGAFGLQEILRAVATWVGADPAEVVVEPNLDFAIDAPFSAELVELMTSKGLGAPISKRSIHDLMRQRDVTSKTFEEELAEIAEEEANEPAPEPLDAAPGGATDAQGTFPPQA